MDTALAAYEDATFARAARSAELAESRGVILSEDSPQGLVAIFAGLDAEQANVPARTLVPCVAG